MKNEKDHSFKLCQLVIFEWINVLKQSELKNIMSCNVLKDLQCLQGNSLEGMLFDRQSSLRCTVFLFAPACKTS